jgi:hypothetical protein
VDAVERYHQIFFYGLAPSGLELIEHWFEGECAGRYRLETGVGVAQGDVQHALLTVEAESILAHRLREIGLDFLKVAACEDVIAFPAGSNG